MASYSEHTEPERPHTYEELMHPGRHHHQPASDKSCPDPSAHRDTRLQEQASTAALYVTSPERKPKVKEGLLDNDKKLSSRSAATSLKYAGPLDLPGYPVVGINTTSSANSAANLANDNKKSFEHWKPEASSNAGKAAMLANDYKMAPLWQPELSAAGSKAALLAHKHGGKVDLWQPEPSAEGNSAASQAMRNKGLSPKVDFGYTADGRNRALMAANGALGRARSGSTPQPAKPAAYPDAANSAANALSAANFANRPSTKGQSKDSNAYSSAAMQAARVQNIGGNVPKEMWGEHPPVQIEVEEKKHNAALRASAVSMAKQMYDVQQRKEKEAQSAPKSLGADAAIYSHGRTPSSTTTPDIKQQAMQYIHLQEAAHKLANERLAKMDPDTSTRYRNYYGYEMENPRSRLSIRGRQRRRADSEGNRADSDDDEQQARRIRSQLAGLNNDLVAVDAKKRQTDRANLLAAAERKVHAQMHNMDEKVFAETGKVSPAMMEEWEAKARAKAAADSKERQLNHGKTNIGGGRYMDMAEIEAIAAARLKPTLDEINDTAERRRARDEEMRLDQEQKKREELSEKNREREVKNIQRRTKEEEKASARAQKQQEKTAAKIEKEAEKSRREEEKRMAKEDKRRTEELKREEEKAAAAASAASVPVADTVNKTPSTPPNQETQEPNLERLETPISIRSPGENSLNPKLEQHVADLDTSESEDDEGAAIVPTVTQSTGTSSSAAAIAARVLTAPVVATSSAEEESAPVITTEPFEAYTERIVTAEPVGKPAPIVEPATITTITATNKSKLTKNSNTDPKSPTRESKGLRSLLSKFKRNSKAPNTTDEVAQSSTTADKTVKSDTSAKVADPISEDTEAVSSIEAPVTKSETPAYVPIVPEVQDAKRSESISSFRRHEEDLHSISSNSSDEEEVTRGREGKSTAPSSGGGILASLGFGGFGGSTTTDTTEAETSTAGGGGILASLGFGGGAAAKTTQPETESDRAVGSKSPALDSGDGSGDEFEEARDTFDEKLAPPPSFGGQAKSSSPVRETKFVEQLCLS